MQIGPVPPVMPAITERQAAPLPNPVPVAKQDPVEVKPPFEPAPPLHPTVQDKIVMVQSLLLLRNV